jgi:iron complex transport system substrate-binding protein
MAALMFIKPAINNSVRPELVEGFLRIEGGMLRPFDKLRVSGAWHERRLEVAGCRMLLLCLFGLISACLPSSHDQTVNRDAHAAHRIVALAPNLAELVYAAGAGEYLVGTVDYADYPEAAKSVPRVGDALHVDYERLLALKPDLILVWPSGTLPSVIEQVKALKLPVQEIDAQRIAEVDEALRLIGVLAGTESAAEQAAVKFDHDMQSLREKYAHQSRMSVFIEVNRQPLYTVNHQQIISEVVELCGGDNVFADLNQLAPVIGVEAVLKVNPQVIISTDGTTDVITQDWKTWPQLQAVHNKHVNAISPDAINRAAPRLVQGAEEVCKVLDEARYKTNPPLPRPPPRGGRG